MRTKVFMEQNKMETVKNEGEIKNRKTKPKSQINAENFTLTDESKISEDESDPEEKCLDSKKAQNAHKNIWPSKANKWKIIAIALAIPIAIALAIALYRYYFSEANSEPYFSYHNKQYNSTLELMKKVKELTIKFPQQENVIWSTFLAGVDLAINDSHPGVFLLLHNNNQKVAECIVKHLSEITIGFLGNNGKPVHINGSTIKSELQNEPSHLNKYKSKVESNSVVVVTELEQIPGEIAKFFHSFCDTYNPMVKKAIYFFILRVEGEFGQKKLLSEVLKVLGDQWKDLEINIRDPLTTRIAQNIVEIKDETIDNC